MSPRPTAKKAPAKAAKKASARKAKALVVPDHRPHRVRVYRNTTDRKWYAERRSANGTLVHRTHGYAKKGRAEEAGRKMAEKADFVLEEPLDV